MLRLHAENNKLYEINQNKKITKCWSNLNVKIRFLSKFLLIKGITKKRK